MAKLHSSAALYAAVYAVFSSGFAYPVAAADGSAPSKMPQAQMRVDSSLVLVPVHVTTSMGAAVTDLRRENFQLFEDNGVQTITHFAKDDATLSIGILLDASGSMRNKTGK